MRAKLFVTGLALAGLNHSSLLAADAPPAGWQEMDRTKDGIVSYKREIEGSDVIAFRGHGVVDAPIARVASVIFDVTRGTEWVEDLEESKVLRWINPLEFIEYDHVGTPIVMKDRDFVTRVTATPNASHDQVLISYKVTDDAAAPKTSYVRGEIIHANFTLISSANGTKTDVDADIHCDPKGSVAKWIVNFFQKQWPVDTFRNLRTEVEKKDIKVDLRFGDLK